MGDLKKTQMLNELFDKFKNINKPIDKNMINYIIMWQRDGDEGFDFINATDEDSAIELWLEKQNGPHPFGRLFKMIIVETKNSYKVPLDTYGYRYYESD